MTISRLPPPQAYSHDLKIRLPLERLRHLALRHRASELDASVLDGTLTDSAALRAGWTEWDAVIDGRVASLAWDWVELSDGHIRLCTNTLPRTNLQLIDAKGYDLSMDHADSLMRDWLGTLGWWREVAAALGNPPRPFFAMRKPI